MNYDLVSIKGLNEVDIPFALGQRKAKLNWLEKLAKQKQTQLQDLAFEIYTKKVVQERLRMEIFQNRKLDIYA